MGTTESALRERVLRLEMKMATALEGVSNFKEFQRDARDFFTRHEEREKAWRASEEAKQKAQTAKDKRRASIHYWWLGLLSALIVAGFTVLLTQFFALRSDHTVNQPTSITTGTK